MNRRCGVLVASATLATAFVVPAGTRAVAQGTAGDTPIPSSGSPASAVDYVGRVFDPAGGSFDFDVDARELKGVGTRVDNVHFSGHYTATPCPDARGTAKASATVSVDLTASGVGVLESYQVELPVEIDVNDKAVYTKARFTGRYFDKIRNQRGNLEDSATRLQDNGTPGSARAVVDNEGAFDRAVLQKRANVVEQHARGLADSIAQKLQAIWQDGKSCVTLSVTPGSGLVKPKQQLQIHVTATAKDGSAVKRPITAALDGPTSVKPKTSKSAPGAFKYVAPAKKGQKGHITFEQRSKRGVGRAEVDYQLSEKWKFDLTATKMPVPGGENNLACDDVRCGSGATLTGPSVTIELGDDGRGAGQGPAVLHVSMATVALADCSVDTSVPVTMVVSVATVGDNFEVTSRSSPDPTYQWCGGFTHNGPESITTPVLFNPVSVAKTGGSNSSSVASDLCLISAHDSGHYGCEYTVTATKLED